MRTCVQGIPKDSWDALLRPNESPFLEHDWLRAMEESKCATIDTGVVCCCTHLYDQGGGRHVLLAYIGYGSVASAVHGQSASPSVHCFTCW